MALSYFRHPLWQATHTHTATRNLTYTLKLQASATFITAPVTQTHAHYTSTSINPPTLQLPRSQAPYMSVEESNWRT
jgi:hypothetical protein